MKKIISILLLILIQVSSFTQLYGNSESADNTIVSKKIVKQEKQTKSFFFDAFENESENEDETDFHLHYFILPFTAAINFFATISDNKIYNHHLIDNKSYIYNCPVFICNRQILI